MLLRLLPRPTDPDSAYGLISRLMREFGRRYTGRYLLALLLLGVAAATNGVVAWLVSDVVDKVFIGKNAVLLFGIAGIVFVVSVVRGVVTFGSTMLLTRVGNGIVANAQAKMFDRVLSLGIDFHDRTHSSDLITRMSTNANAARQVLDTIITSAGRDFLTLIALIVVMLIQSPILAVVVIVIGPLALFSINRLVRSVRTVATEEYRSLGRVVASMQEAALGARVIKAFNLEPIMRERMDSSIKAVRNRANRIALQTARAGPLMEILSGSALAAIILFGGYSIIYLGQKPGAFMGMIAAVILAADPARRLGRTRIQIEAGLVGVRMMFELLDQKPSFDANPDGPDLVISTGEVVFDKVDFAYAGGSPLFRGLDFRAAGGRMTALVGPSGSGKSTIIALIERFYDVDGGHIAIDGQKTSKVKLDSLRRALSLVSQDTVLFRDTVRQNIRIGRPDASDAEVEAAARDANAHDFILGMANGYETQLGGENIQLSGGQRQRLAIARAMLRNAPIVLLDEATSSLDTESERQVQIAFNRLMAGRTTIVIAHRLSTVLGAHRICVLVDGRIVEQGRHAELLATGGRYARLYRLQFESQDPDALSESAPAA
ncbi:MAG: ABC transporter ATP-binding protein [Bauldia sp.]